MLGLLSRSAYDRAVWRFPDGSGKQAADFALPAHQSMAAAAVRQQYCFNIESSVLRLATISPRDRIVPNPSVLLEARDIQCVRVDGGTQQSITKTVTIPGSTLKQALMFTGDVNDAETSQAHAVDTDTTGLTSLQWTVSGQQLQLPQYDLNATAPEICSFCSNCCIF